MSLTVEQTPIPGLLVVRRPVHRDARGWFTEAWQRERMVGAGLPDFGPIQHNVSHNATRGSTRGIHAEPWDKLVTVVHGSVFGAWVDLRAGEGFGAVVTLEVDETVAVFVPRGVGNSYQALADGTVYSYLVNEHWRRRPDGGHRLAHPAGAGGDQRQGPAQPEAGGGHALRAASGARARRDRSGGPGAARPAPGRRRAGP